jgi:hypothetical protein
MSETVLPSHVRLDDDLALDVLARDGVRPALHADLRELGERHSLSCRRIEHHAADRLGVRAQPVGEAHDEVEALSLLQHL